MPNIWDTIIAAESGGKNVTNPTPTSSGNAGGYYQITSGTWADYAPRAGVNLSQYATADAAPMNVQTAVANQIPLNRWASSTVQAVQNAFGPVDTSLPLGQVAGALGQGASGPASAGGSATGGASSTASTGPCGLLSGGFFSWGCWQNVAADAALVFAGLAMVLIGVSAGIHQSPVDVVNVVTGRGRQS